MEGKISMDDLISRQALLAEYDCLHVGEPGRARKLIEDAPSAQPDLNEWCTDCKEYDKEKHHCPRYNRVIREALKDAKPERYTKEELKIFLHEISLRLLSLQSAQYWGYSDKTAKETEFLAHLYEKVEADLKGKT
jgi:hypothetical protein